MKAKALVLFSLLLLTAACEKGGFYSKFDGDFDSNRWVQSDTKSHEFTITDDAKPYDLVLRFSHVYDYQFASVPMVIQITAPSGEVENAVIDLKIKDSSGKELGDCSGDICDLEFKIKDRTKLEKGKYKVILAHSFNGPYLPNVIGVGLDVRVSE
nr:hypothetical protein [uncultured Flavobacterium sp.]